MAKPIWGTKRDCPSCSARFYDLGNHPAHCPKCDTEFDPSAKVAAPPPPPPEPAKPTPPAKSKKTGDKDSTAKNSDDDAFDDVEDILVEDDDDDDDDEKDLDETAGSGSDVSG
jgi:hypothetical protein